MREPGGSEYARFAALVPELAAVVLRRERGPKRMASAGVKLGGLPAWGVEQARFSAELTEPELAEACRLVSFQPVPPRPVGGFKIDAHADQHSAAVARFKVVGQNGERLELLVSHNASQRIIIADGSLAHKMIRLMHPHPKRMSAIDLSGLFRLIAGVAAAEADLAEEINGLSLAAGTKWLSAPRVVSHGDHFLLETSLDGVSVEDLPASLRVAAYRQVVLRWASLLLEHGILHTFLRRDQIRLHGDSVGAARWAGAYRPGPAVQGFVPALARAAFGPTAADRARERSRLLGFLAYGLGVTGRLEDLADLCLALVSHAGPSQPAGPLMPDLFICQQQHDPAPDRMGLTRLLRQLVWFRDLGLACGAPDLAAPWRELAYEAGSGL
jgi:hypothetical protein